MVCGGLRWIAVVCLLVIPATRARAGLSNVFCGQIYNYFSVIFSYYVIVC